MLGRLLCSLHPGSIVRVKHRERRRGRGQTTKTRRDATNQPCFREICELRMCSYVTHATTHAPTATRGRSLPALTRQYVATSSRPTSQERPVTKEERHEIRVGLQNLSDMIMNVKNRIERMKEAQSPKPAKRANLSQQDDGKSDYLPLERDTRTPSFQQTVQAEPRGSAFSVPAHQRLTHSGHVSPVQSSVSSVNRNSRSYVPETPPRMTASVRTTTQQWAPRTCSRPPPT